MNIRMVTAEAIDPAELKDFYCSTLGLALADSDDHSFTVQIGQTELEFRRHTGKLHPVYHFAINIPANKIEEATTWLLQRATLIPADDASNYIIDFPDWNAKSVYFFDPAGNILELIARFDLKNATEEPFSSRQFLSISEVALVVEAGELDAKTKQLLTDFNLSYFSKQPPLETFRAIGDDEGLLIVVPEGRAWYPTKDKMSERAPLKVYFSHNSTDGLLEYDHELQNWSGKQVKFT
jgi:catechol-2,3-dioxygenase